MPIGENNLMNNLSQSLSNIIFEIILCEKNAIIKT